jgi:uncharacterized protein YqjF (DUF2071 family)
MLHSWTDLTFIHWSFQPALIRPLLPPQLELDTFEDRAWIALAPFVMCVRPPRLGPLPGLASVPETNVRTYVRDGSGRRGIWFFSLDLSTLWAVLGARAGLRLPYIWSKMNVRRSGSRVRYTGSRFFSDRAGSYDITIQIAAHDADGSPLERFLTERWRLFTVIAGRLMQVSVQHSPWPLKPASIIALDQSLLGSAGIPEPESEPLVHFSEGVRVRVGFPRPAVSKIGPR